MTQAMTASSTRFSGTRNASQVSLTKNSFSIIVSQTTPSRSAIWANLFTQADRLRGDAIITQEDVAAEIAEYRASKRR